MGVRERPAVPLACAWSPAREASFDRWHEYGWPVGNQGGRHWYDYTPDSCYTTGECAVPRDRQEQIVDWHRSPLDGYGGCHYLHDGYRCTSCGREREGSAVHGGQGEDGARDVVCGPCQTKWLERSLADMRLAQALATSKPPTAPEREVKPIVLEEKLTLW